MRKGKRGGEGEGRRERGGAMGRKGRREGGRKKKRGGEGERRRERR